MAIKVREHNGEEHAHKITKGEVFGLIIDNTETDNVGEAFGWSNDRIGAFMTAFDKFCKMQFAIEDLNEDLPKSTKISTLFDFLKSDHFKKLGIKIETPNDYLMVGYAWSGVSTRNDPLPAGGLFELLKHLSEHKKGEGR